MKKFLLLTFVLGLVGAISAGALALTYTVTKPQIQKQEAEVRKNALKKVFFRIDFTKAHMEDLPDGCTAIFLPEISEAVPAYYAAPGAGIGYNTAVPIELLVGFTNPACKDLPEQNGKNGSVCVGWKVIKSEETPGLGENAKNEEPPFTIAEVVTGNAKPAGPDRRTAFQKQFEGKLPAEMEAKKTIDTITAATYSTVGIINAVKDAEATLQAALEKQSAK